MSDWVRRLFVIVHIVSVAVLALGCVLAFVLQRYDAALILVGAVLGAGIVELENKLERKAEDW